MYKPPHWPRPGEKPVVIELHTTLSLTLSCSHVFRLSPQVLRLLRTHGHTVGAMQAHHGLRHHTCLRLVQAAHAEPIAFPFQIPHTKV